MKQLILLSYFYKNVAVAVGHLDTKTFKAAVKKRLHSLKGPIVLSHHILLAFFK